MPKLLKSKPLMFGLVATTIAAGIGLHTVYTNRRPENLNAVLDYYGFKTTPQKEALRFLMQQAGIKNTNPLLDQKRADQTALLKSIFELVSETQEKFTKRAGKNVERWDVKTSEWMNNSSQQTKALSALDTLGIMKAIPPSLNKTDAICILGATKSTMESRLKYVGNLFAANKLPAQWLIMLAGERYVTPNRNDIIIDGSMEDLSILAVKTGKDVSMLTETDLMREAHEQSTLYGEFPNRTVIIHTPKRDLPRPTTETTIIELCAWLKQHTEVQKITFVSNQPYVGYQAAIIAQVFEKEGMKVKFEVIGPEYSPENQNDADKVNTLLQAVGSMIWAKTPGVIDAIGLEIPDNLRAEYIALYTKQQLIYNNLQNKFNKLN